MGQFNEIPKGLPDLGKNYWQEQHSKSDDSDTDIIKMNCRTIFSTTKNITIQNNKSIFNK